VAKINPLAVDPNGNDLRLEGRFLRTSGRRGRIVDVEFLASR
jgi:hypothetical protein